MGGLGLLPGWSWARTVERRLLVQTAAATATVGAALGLVLPTALAAAVGRADLVPPLLLGAGLIGAVALASFGRLFDAPMLPAAAPWSPARTAALSASASGGWRSLSLLAGLGLAHGASGALAGEMLHTALAARSTPRLTPNHAIPTL